MAAIKPPFTAASAYKKVKAAQALWNTRTPEKVSQAYTSDCIWRNRSTFIRGHAEIVEFLTAKWRREQNYRLRKELFCFGGGTTTGDHISGSGDSSGSGGGEGTTHDRIAVQFWYEYQDADDGLKWKRCYGIEHWTFGADGKMRKRMMSGNDVEIGDEGRWFRDGVDVDDVEIGEKHF